MCSGEPFFCGGLVVKGHTEEHNTFSNNEGELIVEGRVVGGPVVGGRVVGGLVVGGLVVGGRVVGGLLWEVLL